MAETAKAVTVTKGKTEEVVVHPLVLLSVVDHYRRVEEVCRDRDSEPPPPRDEDRERR